MYNKVNSKENEKKENNKIRVIYSLCFVVALIFLSITYAYLAIGIDVKEHAVSPGEVKPSNSNLPSNVVSNSNYVPTSNPKSNPTSNPPSNPSSNKPTPTPVEKPEWNIILDNVVIGEGSVEPIMAPTIDSKKTTVTYEVGLEIPGEYFTFDVDMVNKGGIDAKIYDIIADQLTDRQKQYLDYTIMYKNGNTISIGDTLLAGQRKTVTVYLKFKDDLEKEDLPEEDEILKLTYQVLYVEK